MDEETVKNINKVSKQLFNEEYKIEQLFFGKLSILNGAIEEIGEIINSHEELLEEISNKINLLLENNK